MKNQNQLHKATVSPTFAGEISLLLKNKHNLDKGKSTDLSTSIFPLLSLEFLSKCKFKIILIFLLNHLLLLLQKKSQRKSYDHMGKQDLSMLPGTSRAGALQITREKTVHMGIPGHSGDHDKEKPNCKNSVQVQQVLLTLVQCQYCKTASWPLQLFECLCSRPSWCSRFWKGLVCTNRASASLALPPV